MVLGLGLATVVPDNGVTAMRVADAVGVRLAGLLIDAGPVDGHDVGYVDDAVDGGVVSLRSRVGVTRDRAGDPAGCPARSPRRCLINI
ncbi:hypothetical protein ACFVYD_35495 [Streptomyces sp. NPDC058301]|uniref:hypothetical protein n=1 Tax=Streptomyces sp. NPDC058301 TaxID=3346436 RepID=UPI0036EE1228